MQYSDTIILGGGAAAYSAAIYSCRYDMKTLLIADAQGGEAATAGVIENYPGVKKIDGFELMQTMREQVKELGAEMVTGHAELVSNVHHCFQVRAGKELYQGKTLIIAVGMEQRLLSIPNEKELCGKGIHYCATCDGPVFRGKTVGIVGGGDSAVKWANQMGSYAKQIYIIAREDNLDRAEPVNRDRLSQWKNVTILLDTEVKELHGSNKLDGVTLSKPYQKSSHLALDGLFVAIGAVPRSEIPAQLSVHLDERGQIIVDRMMKTSVDGVYAAGDITDATGSFKQVVTGAAQGALAATSAFHDVQEHAANMCELHAVPSIPSNKLS